MSKSNTNISSDNKNVKFSDSNTSNNASFSYNTNTNNQQQDVNESVNRALDQTKDNINRSIEESRNQIPHYNTIVNSYQEQTLQAVKEITENYIESQKINYKLYSISMGSISTKFQYIKLIHVCLLKQQPMHIVDL